MQMPKEEEKRSIKKDEIIVVVFQNTREPQEEADSEHTTMSTSV